MIYNKVEPRVDYLHNSNGNTFKDCFALYYDRDRIDLYSYNTLVCSIIDGNVMRRWDGYSATTMRHVNSFLQRYGYSSVNKNGWLEMSIYA